MKLENMLNEMSDTKGQILYVWFHLYMSRVDKFIEAESRLEITWGWGAGRMGIEFLLWMIKKFGE